jgi:hypothetical protein
MPVGCALNSAQLPRIANGLPLNVSDGNFFM